MSNSIKPIIFDLIDVRKKAENYLGINEEYDNVNKSMYFDNLEDVKQFADEIICFYSDNDPYVKYEVEKDFADKIRSRTNFNTKCRTHQ